MTLKFRLRGNIKQTNGQQAAINIMFNDEIWKSNSFRFQIKVKLFKSQLCCEVHTGIRARVFSEGYIAYRERKTNDVVMHQVTNLSGK